MKTPLYLILTTLLFAVTSCDTAPNNKITNRTDYDTYLYIKTNKALDFAQSEFNFWANKFKKTPDQFTYLGKIAAAESQLFQNTGNIDFLINEAENLLEINNRINYSNAGYLRSLARNYISQHKFKEALSLLLLAEKNGENLIGTHKMLFDVYLELGNNKKALHYLSSYKNFSDFDYLIRLSKWNDHSGNLKEAIHFMEKALVIAESSQNNDLKQWIYTNIADYYGHAGEIKKSYTHYLKALAINPNDSYSLKGIAWIIYSYEKNPTEALRIINAISKRHNSPDYYLLKAEIADYMNNKVEKNKNIIAYTKAVNNPKYGDMYNKYNVLLNTDELNNTDLALQIATNEVANRPTSQSYDLLAWSYYTKGNFENALKIAQQHIVNKTHEPEAMYHLAEIYKANKNFEEVENLKMELNESAFELGPVMAKKIANL